jgi:hypothetical protein
VLVVLGVMMMISLISSTPLVFQSASVGSSISGGSVVARPTNSEHHQQKQQPLGAAVAAHEDAGSAGGEDTDFDDDGEGTISHLEQLEQQALVVSSAFRLSMESLERYAHYRGTIYLYWQSLLKIIRNGKYFFTKNIPKVIKKGNQTKCFLLFF